MRKRFIGHVILISAVLMACTSNTTNAKSVTKVHGTFAESSKSDKTEVEKKESESSKEVESSTVQSSEETTKATEVPTTQEESTTAKETEVKKDVASEVKEAGEIGLNPDWQYASFSKINSGKSMLYKPSENGNGITIAVNAGHGTKGGSSQKTQCHPDGTPKVTGGTTKAGATTAIAVSEGMTFSDGTPESTVTYEMAKILKDELLSRGYNVLMIRNDTDVQLDNIARTVIANNIASAHIALHWDSTTSDKGAFYMGVPDVASYRSMEPVASNWKKHEALGKSLINGLSANGTKIFSNGRMDMDLTQTSYSTIPSIDIELGDKTSDYGKDTLRRLSKGLADGIDSYFGR